MMAKRYLQWGNLKIITFVLTLQVLLLVFSNLVRWQVSWSHVIVYNHYLYNNNAVSFTMMVGNP